MNTARPPILSARCSFNNLNPVSNTEIQITISLKECPTSVHARHPLVWTLLACATKSYKATTYWTGGAELGLGFNGGGGGAFFPASGMLTFGAGGVYGGGAAPDELAAPGGGGGAFFAARELKFELADGARRIEEPGVRLDPEVCRLCCNILAARRLSEPFKVRMKDTCPSRLCAS
jgi:hypothetical protein